MPKTYDFSGWATRNDLKCADGRTIRKGAFKEQDGKVVPLVYMHNHEDISDVLGHALLEDREEGVYAYCSFNDTENAKAAKEQVRHGDIRNLSIYANHLKQRSGEVLHGVIREVSLVLAGANPGAVIDFPEEISHSDDDDAETEAFIWNKEEISLAHAEEGVQPMPNVNEPADRTIQEVYDSMDDEQKNVVHFLIGKALEQAGEDVQHSDNDGEDEEALKHNVFDNDTPQTSLSHEDMQKIFANGKRLGSLKAAVEEAMADGIIQHDVMNADGSVQTYGMANIDYLFPDYRTLQNQPEFIRRDTEWVNTVMNGVHHTPFSRIKTVFANITMEEARARGYIKGHRKVEEVFSLLKRTTDPQTVYKKQKLDRDDVIDVTDFDVVAYMKGEMRGMLDEEIARAILIGDGRLATDEDKIQESHIRPIATDDELFTIRIPVTAGTDDAATAKSIIRAMIKNRKQYKGSGNLTFFITEDWLSEMLLLEDGFGHALYNDVNALATKLRVNRIVPVQLLEGQTIDGNPLVGVAVDLKDYNVGADKGGAVAMFDDFDIDYNQMKYLIETRCSGALIRPFSAMTVTIGGKATKYSEVENPTGSPREQGYYVKEGDVYVKSGETTVDSKKTYYEKE